MARRGSEARRCCTRCVGPAWGGSRGSPARRPCRCDSGSCNSLPQITLHGGRAPPSAPFAYSRFGVKRINLGEFVLAPLWTHHHSLPHEQYYGLVDSICQLHNLLPTVTAGRLMPIVRQAARAGIMATNSTPRSLGRTPPGGIQAGRQFRLSLRPPGRVLAAMVGDLVAPPTLFAPRKSGSSGPVRRAQLKAWTEPAMRTTSQVEDHVPRQYDGMASTRDTYRTVVEAWGQRDWTCAPRPSCWSLSLLGACFASWLPASGCPAVCPPAWLFGLPPRGGVSFLARRGFFFSAGCCFPFPLGRGRPPPPSFVSRFADSARPPSCGRYPCRSCSGAWYVARRLSCEMVAARSQPARPMPCPCCAAHSRVAPHRDTRAVCHASSTFAS